MRIILLMLVVFFGLLQYRLWFGKNSVSDYLALKNEMRRQQTDNTKLTQRNKLVYADIDDLKSGLDAIEERARNDLGMIKKGETFFRLIPNDKSTNNQNKKN